MIGKTLAHYRVLSLLGRGGMGEVYLAENLRLKNKVALKFLSPELSRDATALQRLQREATAAAELDHPNIARIHDMQEVEGQHFLVMEYVKGETLADRLASQGKLDPEESREIIRGIAAGLEHAHGIGIVHRDIKSANVMLTPDGGVKILDLGLAQHRDVTRLTQPGSIVGTLSYMSPEQIRGAPVDERTDLWSLGVVLYECLTGQRPFDGPSAESTMHNILEAMPSPVSKINPGVSPVLDGVLARLLEKDPTRRYTTARDVARDLGPSPSSARTVPLAPRGRRTHRWLIPAAIAAIAVVATMAIVRWRGIGTESSSGTPRLAVVGFANLSAQPESLAAAGLAALLQVGLADIPGCDMVAPELLRDIQRRRFGSGFASVDAAQAMQVAREAGAMFMVSGEIVDDGETSRVLWRITDTEHGNVLASGQEDATTRMDLADRVTGAAAARLEEIMGFGRPKPVLPPSATVTGSHEAYAHYLAGLVAKDSGRDADAQQEFLRATELDSTFALAYFELSKSYEPSVEPELAARAVGKAWRYRTQLSSRDALLLEAYRLSLDYKVSQADAVYDRVLLRWPDSKEALVAKVQSLGYFRRFRQCERAARQGLRYYPQEPELLAYLALTLTAHGEWDEALEVVESMPVTGSRSQVAYRSELLAEIQLLMGDVVSADLCFQQAASANPESIWPHIWLSACLYARGDLAGAIRMQSDALTDPRWTPAQKEYLGIAGSSFMSLSTYYADAGRITEAQTVEGYSSLFILLYAGLNEIAGALLDEVGYDGSTEDRSLAMWQWGVRALARAGDVPQAREIHADLIRRVAGNADLPGGFRQRNLEAGIVIELAAGAPRKALEHVRELEEEGVMRGGAVDVQFRQVKAETYAALGDLDRAMHILETTLGTYGGRTLGHYQLAQYYEEAGRKQDARNEYQKCLSLWKNADVDYPYPAIARERLAKLNAGRSE